MLVIFVLVFLATLVGLFRPYAGLNRKQFLAGAIGTFILVALVAPQPKATAPAAAAADNATEMTTVDKLPDTEDSNAKPAPVATASEAPSSKWEYSDDKDPMRGTTTHFAVLPSENQEDLDFPYGTVSGHLTVRRRPSDGLQIMFSVDKGQILCSNFSSSHVSVKFDDGPVQNFECSSSSDGSSETAFIESKSRFLERLKRSTHTVVEAEFYSRGRKQFSFDTAHLKWDR